MLIRLCLYPLFFASLSMLHSNPCKSKHDKLEAKCDSYSQSPKWPLFTNENNSWVYILGLFLSHRISMATAKHFQAPAEPAMFQAAILVAQKLNITVNGKQIAYHVEKTNGSDVIEALDRTCFAIAEYQVLGIVGSEYSSEAKTLVRFGNRAGLPIIGYSTTEPELSDRKAYKTFYRMPPSEIITALALLRLFEKFNWKSTNVIYQGDSYGQSGLQALDEIFNDKIKITCSIRFDVFTNRIENLHRQLEDSSSRIVIVIAAPFTTIKILNVAMEVGEIMAPSFLWILTASNSSMNIPYNQNVNQLTGMLILRLVSPQTFNISINKTLLHDALEIWEKMDPESFNENKSQLDIFALYAFDSAWFLILALQQLCQKNSTNCLTLENYSNCFGSQLTALNEFHQILQTISFNGLIGRVQFDSSRTDRVDNTGVYYMIDNLQPSRMNDSRLQIVEVLGLNGIQLNDTCNNVTEWVFTGNPIRWPKGWKDVPPDYALLKGKKLNITVYISEPFFMSTSTPDSHGLYVYDGYIHELLLLLKAKMGFNYNYIVASNQTTYDELVECVKNRTCDIVMTDLAMTPTRLAKIDFIVPIYRNTMRLLVRKSNDKTISPFAFLKPFSLLLWLMIIGIIYIPSTLFIMLFEYRDRKSGIYDISPIKALGKSLYHTIGALAQRGSEIQVRTMFGCLQTIIIWLMSVIIIALLTSNLISYFTAQREQSWLKGINDLERCRAISCNRIGVVEHSQHEEYFKKEIAHGAPMDYYPLKHPKKCFTKLLDSYIDVAIVDSATAEYMTQKEYCQLELVGAPFGQTDFGVALPKQWPYKQDLDRHILELTASDAIKKRLAKYTQQIKCNIKNDQGPQDQNHELTFFETSGLFIIFGVLTVLNFTIFMLDYAGVFRKITCFLNRRNQQTGERALMTRF